MPTRLAERAVMRNMLASMILPEIANGEICALAPCFDQLSRAIRRSIVNYQPFKISRCLRLQTIEYAAKGVRTIVGRSKYSY